MKTFNFLRLLCVAAFMYAVTSVSAKQIYVASGGNDANSGSTQLLALKTINAALVSAVSGDEILIVGTVPVTQECIVSANVRFTGLNDATIDGKGTTALFTITAPLEDGKSVIFANIIFQNGLRATAGGGAVKVNSGVAHFSACQFYTNTGTAGDGGAVCVTGTGTVGEFYNCIFADNISTLRGGALGVTSNAAVSVQYTQFQGNSTTPGSAENRGGAISLTGCKSARFFESNITSNYTGNNTILDATSGGGGAFFITGTCAFYMEACSIIGNVSAGDHGAAFFIVNAPNMTIVNTTIAGNVHMGGAGTMFCTTDPNFTLTLVNVTMTNNIAASPNNGGNAGIRILNAGASVNVFNSILVGNKALDGLDSHQNGVCDIVFSTGTDNNTIIKNSIVGYMHRSNVANFKVTDNSAITNKSLVNEYDFNGLAGSPLAGDWTTNDLSGMYGEGMQSSSNGVGYYSLTAGAYAASLGDPALLSNYDVNTDQFLKTRATTNGSIWAGSVQGLIADATAVDPIVPADAKLLSTGIKKISVDDLSISPVPVSTSGVLTVNFGSLTGQVKGELVSVSGQVVKTLFNQPVVAKGFYAMDGVAPGYYILKITQGYNVVTRSLIVK